MWEWLLRAGRSWVVGSHDESTRLDLPICKVSIFVAPTDEVVARHPEIPSRMTPSSSRAATIRETTRSFWKRNKGNSIVPQGLLCSEMSFPCATEPDKASDNLWSRFLK